MVVYFQKTMIKRATDAVIVALTCATVTFPIMLPCNAQSQAGFAIPERSGFSTEPHLAPVGEALRKQHFKEAQDLATAVINLPAQAFKSNLPAQAFNSGKLEQYVKARAHYYRALAEGGLSATDAQIKDFKRAADMGDSDAAFYASTILMQLAVSSKPMQTASTSMQEAFGYIQMAAELGATDAMAIVAKFARSGGRRADETYWSSLHSLDNSPDKQRLMTKAYEEKLMDGGWKELAQVMREQSISGREVPAANDQLPGRSSLTSALVDLRIRRQLEFVWRAFFKPDAPDENVLALFQHHRESLTNSPFAAAYLITTQANQPDDQGVVVVSSHRDLADSVLPGDSIVVRCGALVHTAVVWEIDRKKERLIMLDPFFEFWQPSHNECVKSFSLKPYKYQRELVELSWPEIQPMMVANISVRDSRRMETK